VSTSNRFWRKTLGRGGELRGGRRRAKGIRTPKPRRPQLEPLEQRQMLTILYWDPDGIAAGNDPGTGAGLGGAGTWADGGGALWYDPATQTNVAWNNANGDDAVFAGDAGTVTLSGSLSAQSLNFATTNYTLASGTLSLPAGGTTFDVDSGVTATIGSTIDGTGALTKIDAGTLVLAANNSYDGQTTVDGGTLQIGAGGTTGTLGSGAVANNANVLFYRTDSISSPIVISNVLGGAGDYAFHSSGATNTGSYRLDATNTLTGTIHVTGARLMEGNGDASFGQASMIYATDGGQIYATNGTFTRDLTLGGTGFSESAGTLGALRLGNAIWEGDITLVADTRITAYRSTGTLSGNLTGNYVLACRTGNSPNGDTITLALGAGSDYGTLKVGSGVTVVAGSNDALNVDTVTMEGGTLKLNGRSFTIGALTGTSGQVQNGHASTASTLTVDVASGTTTYSATLANGGAAPLALTKAGEGTFVLGGSSANTYTGATTLADGVLKLNKSAGVAAVSGSVYFEGSDNPYLHLGASEQIPNSGSLYFNTPSGYGRFNLFGHTETVAGIHNSNGRGVIQNVQSESGVSANGTLIVNNTADCAFVGYLREKSSGDSTGLVSLVKQGTGTLTLTGSQITYTGGTTVSGGKLTLQDTTNATFLSKNITNNAALEFNATSTTLAYTGVISGTGSLGKIGAGTLTLGGSTANTYAGGTTVSAGTLRLGKPAGVTALPGDVYFEGTSTPYLYLDASEQIADSAQLYFNNTAGYGRFNLFGHTETVAGIHDSIGRGIIQNVQSESGVSANGAFILNNTADCSFVGYFRDKSSGDSSGKLSLVKNGTGTLVLAPNPEDAYTGTTTINAGTLVLRDVTQSSLSAAGVVNDATLEFNTVAASTTFNANISGTGNVVKTGTRNLALGGDNSFSGEIHVYAGRFRDVSGPANFGNPSRIYVHEGGQVYTYNDATYNFPLSIAGIGHSESAGHLGALRLSNEATWAGNITLTADARITAYDALATITGNITDGANDYQLTFASGDGYPGSALILDPTTGNTWSGGTLIAGAVVRLGSDNAFPAMSALVLGDPALGAGGLDLDGHDVSLSSLATGTPNPNHSLFWDEISNTSGSNATLTIQNDDDLTYGGVLSGNLALAKYGSGTLTLEGENYATATATVYEGWLEIESSYLGNVVADGGFVDMPGRSWYSLSVGSKSGEFAGEFYNTLSVPSTPIGVVGDWRAAVKDAASGTLLRLDPLTLYSFQDPFTGQAYRVGTVAELNAAVRAMHNDADAFALDSSLSGDTKLIVLESLLGYTSCDYDYDDVYWIVTASQIQMSLDGDPEPVLEGSTYTLTLGEVTGAAQTPTSYTIHWGDGTSSGPYTETQLDNLSRQLTHAYPDGPATPTITVDVTIGGVACTALASREVTVDNVAPQMGVSGPATVDEGSPYVLTLDEVVDPGEETYTYAVHWGDGTTTTYDASNPLPPSREVEHIYADEAASRTITVDLADEDGTYLDVASTTVEVNNVAPTITPFAEYARDNQTVGLALSMADPGADGVHDIDGDGVPERESGGALTLEIDWGDGENSSFQWIEESPGNEHWDNAGCNLIHCDAATSTWFLQHEYDGDQAFTITITVTDEDGTYETLVYPDYTSFTVIPRVDTSAEGLSLRVSSLNSDPARIREGDLYVLEMSIDGLGQDDEVSGWTIDWGDGRVTTQVEQPDSGQDRWIAAHRYADGGATYDGVSVTAHVARPSPLDPVELEATFTPYLPGDTDQDGDVNAEVDLAALAAHWQMAEGATWADGDFDGDGGVDGRDAAMLAAHWQRAGGNQLHVDMAVELDDCWVSEHDPGAVVGILREMDPGIEDQYTYELHVNPDDLFVIDGDVLRLAAGVELNYEDQSFYEVQIKVYQTGAPESFVIDTFTICVSDLAILGGPTYEVAEPYAIHFDVPDLPGSQWTVHWGDGQTTPVTLADGLDEVTHTYLVGEERYFIVAIRTDGTTQYSNTLEIQPETTAPVVLPGQHFKRFVWNRDPISPTWYRPDDGATIGTVRGRSCDGSSLDPGAQWEIVSHNSHSGFGIDPATGRLYVRNSWALAFETETTYAVEVVVTENGVRSAPQVVMITFSDWRSSLAPDQVFSMLGCPWYAFPRSDPLDPDHYPIRLGQIERDGVDPETVLGPWWKSADDRLWLDPDTGEVYYLGLGQAGIFGQTFTSFSWSAADYPFRLRGWVQVTGLPALRDSDFWIDDLTQEALIPTQIIEFEFGPEPGEAIGQVKAYGGSLTNWSITENGDGLSIDSAGVIHSGYPGFPGWGHDEMDTARMITVRAYDASADEYVIGNVFLFCSDSLVLLYWVIGVDGTFVVAGGYVFCGDRVAQVRCVPANVGTRWQCGRACRSRTRGAGVVRAVCVSVER